MAILRRWLKPCADLWRIEVVTATRKFVWAACGAGIWALAAGALAQYVPLGECARLLAPPQNDPVAFDAWFAAQRPFFDRLAGMGLAAFPAVLLAVWTAARVLPRAGAFLLRAPVFAAVALVFLLASFPPPIAPAAAGLDESWQWFLNYAAGRGLFGRTVVFTYGPLGFLLVPQVYLANAVGALAANLFFLVFWGYSLAVLFRAGVGGRRAAALLLVTMLFPQMTMEWRWLALAVVAPSVVLVRRLAGCAAGPCTEAVLMAGAGIVLALASLMKFSLLVTAAGTQALLAGVAACATRPRRFAVLALGPVAALGAFAALAACVFDAWADLFAWVRGSIAIASGYAQFFGDEKSFAELAVAPAAVALAVAVFRRERTVRRALLLLAVALTPLAFGVLKYAWTRQGPLPCFYLVCVAVALAVACAPLAARRALALSVALGAVSLALVVPRAALGTWKGAFPCGLNPCGLVATARLASAAENAQRETARRMADQALPVAWVEMIGAHSVQLLPYDFTPAMGADRLNFQSVPVLQLYSAYLPELDARCAAVYAHAAAPSFLVVSDDPQWCGYFFNHPQTWRAVLRHYEFVAAQDARILLRRRRATDEEAPGVPPSPLVTVARAGEWVAWPDAAAPDAAVSLGVDWRPTWLGRAVSFLFRNTLTYVTCRYADGREVRFPLNPATCRTPFPVAAVPNTAADMVRVFRQEALPVPVAWRFEALTPALYSPTLRLTWQSARDT